MGTETITMMVEGGNAVAGPAIGQKLGPLRINVQDVLKKVNEKTFSFKGMQVSVKLKIDTSTKNFEIDVGTPPTSQLIKKELNLEKGAKQSNKEKVANISIEQCIKIAKMKIDSMYTFNLKAAVKSVVGSCNSIGVLIEGNNYVEITKDIEAGKYDNEISSGKTDVSPEKKERLRNQFEEIKTRLAQEAEKLKALEAEISANLAPAAETKESTPTAAPKAEEKKEVKEEKKRKE